MWPVSSVLTATPVDVRQSGLCRLFTHSGAAWVDAGSAAPQLGSAGASAHGPGPAATSTAQPAPQPHASQQTRAPAQQQVALPSPHSRHAGAQLMQSLGPRQQQHPWQQRAPVPLQQRTAPGQWKPNHAAGQPRAADVGKRQQAAPQPQRPSGESKELPLGERLQLRQQQAAAAAQPAMPPQQQQCAGMAGREPPRSPVANISLLQEGLAASPPGPGMDFAPEQLQAASAVLFPGFPSKTAMGVQPNSGASSVTQDLAAVAGAAAASTGSAKAAPPKQLAQRQQQQQQAVAAAAEAGRRQQQEWGRPCNVEVQLASDTAIEVHAQFHFYHPAVVDALSKCASCRTRGACVCKN